MDTNSSKRTLIAEWLTRFALNAEKALTAKEQAVYRSLWEDGFADVDADRLKAAFVACLRTHTYKTIPTIGDVRQHLSKADANAIAEEGSLKFERLLAYAVRLSPDIPERNPPKLSERVRAAIRAAGGLDHLRDCGRDDLQWARKRFIESYIRFGELERDGNLLHEGALTNLITDGANQKLLPVDAYKAARSLGLAAAEKSKELCIQELDTRRAVAAIQTLMRSSAPRPPARSIEEQKRVLLKRGLLPETEGVLIGA